MPWGVHRGKPLALTGCALGALMSCGGGQADHVNPVPEGGLATDAAGDSFTGKQDEGGDSGGSVSCSAGSCQPIVLSAQNCSLTGVATDGKHVFWTLSPPGGTGGGLFQTTVGSANGTPLVLAQGSGDGLATDGTNVYWFGPGGLLQSAVGAENGTPLVLASSSTTWGTNLATDGNAVYWTETGSVNEVALAPGSHPTLVMAADDVPIAPVTDGKNVYWLDYHGYVSQIASGVTNGVPIRLALDPDLANSLPNGDPPSIATDGKNVYWATYTAIKRVPVDTPNGTPITLVANVQPIGLATDGKNVYWFNPGGDSGTVDQISVAAENGSPLVIAINQGFSGCTADASPFIATDGINVYWIAQNGHDPNSTVNQIAAIAGACAGRQPMCFAR